MELTVEKCSICSTSISTAIEIEVMKCTDCFLSDLGEKVIKQVETNNTKTDKGETISLSVNKTGRKSRKPRRKKEKKVYKNPIPEYVPKMGNSQSNSKKPVVNQEPVTTNLVPNPIHKIVKEYRINGIESAKKVGMTLWSQPALRERVISAINGIVADHYFSLLRETITSNIEKEEEHFDTAVNTVVFKLQKERSEVIIGIVQQFDPNNLIVSLKELKERLANLKQVIERIPEFIQEDKRISERKALLALFDGDDGISKISSNTSEIPKTSISDSSDMIKFFGFRNPETAYLCSMAFSSFIHEGKKYKSLAHFYYAMQLGNEEEQEIIRKIQKPLWTKKAFDACSSKLEMNDEQKVAILYDGNFYKFSQYEKFRTLLLATGNCQIVEENYDPFWREHHGKVLMGVREELRRIEIDKANQPKSVHEID